MICSTHMSRDGEQGSHRGAFRSGSAAAGLALLLSGTAFSAFVAFHGWGTRPSQWTLQQSVLEFIADYGGLGALGLPTVLVAIAAGSLVAGGLIGRRARRLVGSPLSRTAKVAMLSVVGYFGVALVVAALPVVVALTRGANGLWTLPLLGIYGLVAAAVLLPLAVVPLIVGAALLESWTRPATRSDEHPSVIGRRAVVAALLLVAAALGTYAAMRFAVREWDVRRADDGTCVVIAGMPRASVRVACGAPTDAGVQPKRGDVVLHPPFVWFCSADVDVFGNSRIDYDCEGKVANVARVDAEGYIRAPVPASSLSAPTP
jgi:hypothetical protein